MVILFVLKAIQDRGNISPVNNSKTEDTKIRDDAFDKVAWEQNIKRCQIKNKSIKMNPLTRHAENIICIVTECLRRAPRPERGDEAIFLKLLILPNGKIKDVFITDEEKLKKDPQLYQNALKYREQFLNGRCNFYTLDKIFYENHKELDISIESAF